MGPANHWEETQSSCSVARAEVRDILSVNKNQCRYWQSFRRKIPHFHHRIFLRLKNVFIWLGSFQVSPAWRQNRLNLLRFPHNFRLMGGSGGYYGIARGGSFPIKEKYVKLNTKSIPHPILKHLGWHFKRLDLSNSVARVTTFQKVHRIESNLRPKRL